VGVAPNKFLAKLASEAAKPSARADRVIPGRGLVEIEPGRELEFLHPLPVQTMWGVGPATLAKLQRLGVVSIGDLAALDRAALTAALGPAAGGHLHRLAHAVDDRPVVPDRVAKSIGHEETYPEDLYDPEQLRAQVVRLSDAVATRLRAAGVAARTVTLKVRFGGFDTVTRAVTPGASLTTGPALAAAVLPLLAAIDPAPGVRLLGVSASQLSEPSEQLTLDDLLEHPSAPPPADAAGLERTWHEASAAIDTVRARFGSEAIRLTSSLRRGRIRPVRPAGQQWGPNDDR
jgi:DNA polymerase-4